jgi:hypothetical protein
MRERLNIYLFGKCKQIPVHHSNYMLTMTISILIVQFRPT